MSLPKRMVTVKQLQQEMFHGRQRSAFLREVTSCLDAERPGLVFDCSQLNHIDKKMIHLLLCCLEEAMKRNGDLRLAEVSAEAKASLKAVEADVLFRFFETSASAVASFHRPTVALELRETVHTYLYQELEEAV